MQSETENSLAPSRVSLRRKTQPYGFKDYVTPSTYSSSHSISPESQVNSVLLKCPIDQDKYNFKDYSPSHTIYACSVSPTAVIKKPYTYNQALPDSR